MTRAEREGNLLQLERRLIQREWCRVMGHPPGTVPRVGKFSGDLVAEILKEEFSLSDSPAAKS
jgi:hypothetical protein